MCIELFKVKLGHTERIGTHHLLVLFSMLMYTSAFSQTCTIIDSIDTSPANIYNPFFKPVGISYDGTGLWVAGSNQNADRVYKYDLSGQRVDSLSYNGSDGPMEAIIVNNGILWGVKYLVDTLYKYDLATETLLAKYSLGMSPDVEEVTDLALKGDTIYMITGGGNINRIKFSMSTGTFEFLGSGNTNPVGIEFWGDHLYGSSWPILTWEGYRIDPVTLMVDMSTATTSWCVNQGMALTTDGTYWYQTNWINKYIYILSNDELSVPEQNNSLIRLSPNPSNGPLTLHGIQNCNYRITGSNGTMLSQGTVLSDPQKIDLICEPGMYLMTLYSEDRVETVRFIIAP